MVRCGPSDHRIGRRCRHSPFQRAAIVHDGEATVRARAFLQPAAETVLGKRVWLTIGQLWKEEQWIFAPSFSDLERWTTQGFSISDFEGKQGLDFHAWLTVETGEIIEPTFLTTLASVKPKIFGDMAGTAVWGRDPNVLLGHRYIPMLIGLEAAETISSMAPVPLLARSHDELRHAPAAIVMIP